MEHGWKCPNCGSAHAPHIETCPSQSARTFPEYAPEYSGYRPYSTFTVPYDPSRPLVFKTGDWLRRDPTTCYNSGDVQ